MASSGNVDALQRFFADLSDKPVLFDDVTIDGDMGSVTPILTYAITDLGLSAVQTLLDNGADVNYCWDGYSPLEAAIYALGGMSLYTPFVEPKELYQKIELLISRQASLAATMRNGETPLTLACQSKRHYAAGVIRLLANNMTREELEARETWSRCSQNALQIALNNPDPAIICDLLQTGRIYPPLDAKSNDKAVLALIHHVRREWANSLFLCALLGYLTAEKKLLGPLSSDILVAHLKPLIAPLHVQSCESFVVNPDPLGLLEYETELAALLKQPLIPSVHDSSYSAADYDGGLHDITGLL